MQTFEMGLYQISIIHSMKLHLVKMLFLLSLLGVALSGLPEFPRFRSYSSYFTSLPYANLYELPIPQESLMPLLAPPPQPPFLFYGPSVPFLSQVATLYIQHHNLPYRFTINPKIALNEYIVTDNPGNYGLAGFFIDFFDMKNVKQVIASHIEEMETRAQVRVPDKEMKDDLPYFEKQVVLKRPKNSSIRTIQRDDEMIKHIESGLSQQESSFFQNKFQMKEKKSQPIQHQSQPIQQEVTEEETKKNANEGLQRCARFMTTQTNDQGEEKAQELPNTQVIEVKDLNIVLEKRKEMNFKYNPNLLGDDNVLILYSKNICVVFDSDLASYLYDKTQPLKSNYDYQVERVGFVEEDVKNVLKLAVQNQQYKQQFQEDKSYLIREEYVITNQDVKEALLNYRPVSNLALANNLYSYHAQQQPRLALKHDNLLQKDTPIWVGDNQYHDSKIYHLSSGEKPVDQFLQQTLVTPQQPINPLPSPTHLLPYTQEPPKTVSVQVYSQMQPQMQSQMQPQMQSQMQSQIQPVYQRVEPVLMTNAQVVQPLQGMDVPRQTVVNGQDSQLNQVRNQVNQLQNNYQKLNVSMQTINRKLDQLLSGKQEPPKKSNNPHVVDEEIISYIDSIKPHTN